MFATMANVKVKAHKLATTKHPKVIQPVVSTKARFDETNLNTTKPKTKDYGLLAITESKTPYPRKEDPVDATLLRDRLLEQIADRLPSVTSMDYDFSIYSDPSSQISSYSGDSASEKANTFEELRRRYTHGEFTLTRQRVLSNSRHPAGRSISSDLTRASIFMT